MDKPSTSTNKDVFMSSPAAVSPGQKQKSRTIENPNVTASKIRKIATDHNGQSQNAPSSQDQNLAGGVVSSQLTTKDPLACFRSRTDKPQTGSSSIDAATDLEETKDRMKQVLSKKKKLRRQLKTFEENTGAMEKDIKNEVRVRGELGEQQNIYEKFKTLVKDRLVDVVDEFEGFKQREKRLTEIRNDAILEFRQRRKDLTERIEAEISKHSMIAARLEVKKNEVSLVVAKTERLNAEASKVTPIANGVENEKNKLGAMLDKNQQRRSEEIGKIDRDVENIEAQLHIVRENNSKLKSLADEDSKRRLQLLSECEALRVSKIQRQVQINDLESSIRDSKERQANTRTRIEEWKGVNLAIISERDAERADYDKQMEESKAKLGETSKKLSDTKSSCEALIDSVTESVNDIEKVEKISDSKDCEIKKLRDELRDVLDLNKDLSAEAGSLKESLADVKEQIAQEKADFETLASEDQSDQLEIEIQEKLADLKRQCEDKEVLLSKLYEEMEAESLKSSREKAKLDEEIVNLDKQLDELQKSKEDCKRDTRKIDSEMNKKLHESTQTSAQCLKAGHEKLINQSTRKLETLRDELSAVKAEYQQENKKLAKSSNKISAERKTKLEEQKSEIRDREKKISAVEKIRDDRKQRSKETRVPAPISARQNSLMSMCYTQNKTPPATSTPEQSPKGADLGLSDKFGFGGSSDESSINSSVLFNDAQRRYENYNEGNKTDAAKLSQTKQPKKK